MEEIFKLFYNSLEKPIDIKGILLSPFLENDKIVWKFDNPGDISFSIYILESYLKDLFYAFCKQAEMTLVPSLPIFWDIDSPKTLYINEELKSKIEQSLLDINNLVLCYDNTYLECNSQLFNWELSQEDPETIFLVVNFKLFDIFIDNDSVDSTKAIEWIEEYYYEGDANIDAEQLLDPTSFIILEEELISDESFMNMLCISVTIDYICSEDNHMASSDVFFDDDKEVSDEVVKSNKDLLAEAIAKLSPEELALIDPNWLKEAQKEEEEISFTYMECFISIEDKYELEDISIFSIETDCDFEFQDSYDKIWISFDKDTNEVYRVIEIPDNVDTTGRCGNSTYILNSFNSHKEALVFFQNLKTISFKKLKKLAGYPQNENLCYFITQKKKIISTDDYKVEILKTYHENGAVKEEIEAVNGKGHGIYKLYYDNCQLKVAIRYENGHQLDGVVDSFDENGFLIRTVEIINGNKNGHFKEFYPSGTIKKEGEYEDDEIIGKPIEYLEDGSIKEDNEDEYLEGLELDSNKSITFIDKTAFINKLKNLDESSIIEIRFDSEKWSINDKATVAGIWNGKNYILYADEWIKNAELIWEETLEELINLLTDNELEDIDSNNCWLGLEGSDGSNIEVNKIEWEPSLSIEDEKKFKDEYGDGIKLFREGQVDNDLFFEAGAIIGIRVITEDEEFYLTEEENIDEPTALAFTPYEIENLGETDHVEENNKKRLIYKK